MFPRCLGLALLFTALASADTFVVLPFANVSKNAPANINWVGESIAETLRETLAAGEAIALDRDEREEAYKQLGIKQNVLLTRASMIKIAGALEADQIVYGEFELTPLPPPPPGSTAVAAVRGSLRISAHVLDLKRMHQGPEFSEQGALEDLASLQMRLAWRTLHFVRGSRAPSEADFQAAHPPVRLDALESFIRGLLTTSKDQKLRFLSQAVRLDPGFSPPVFRLGLFYYDQQEFRPASEWFAKVKHSDAHYRESVFLLGVSRFSLGDFAEAQACFEQLAKDLPLASVINNVGACQARRNLPEALSTLDRAIEADPGDPSAQFNAALVLWKQSEFDKAAAHLKEILDRDASDIEAKQLLERCEKRNGPRPREHVEFQERLKPEYEEAAYLQLKSVLQSNGKP
ncbi:MAG TPA: tetratricopeptide repeat protein [Bryobacteraceae bacterium]